MIRRLFAAAPIALALTAGCLTDTGLTPSSIERVANTDQQQAPGGSRLALRVVVRTDDGSALVRAGVRWSIVSEPGTGGALSDSVTLSDGTGLAEVEVTLGRAEGMTTVRAELVDDESKAVDFTATATKTPSLTGVSPATFGAGDQVVMSGSNLDVATGFDIGGVQTAPVAVAGDGSTATVAIPPCLPTGQVAIRAVAGTAISDAVFGDFTSAAGTITLQVGEYLSLSPSALAGCAAFPAAGPGGAEYIVAAQSGSGIPGDSAAYRLRGTGGAPPAEQSHDLTVRRALSPADRFHHKLRELEREWSRLPPSGETTIREAPAAGVIKLGVERLFRVCANTSCSGEFATVRGEARYVGQHAVIYQDLAAPSGGLSESDFLELGETFDSDLYIVGTRAFGAESDVDGDGRVAILLTPVVNQLTETATCDVSFIAGFFLAIDINPGSAGDPRSNQAEVFYSIVPDPEGEISCAFTVDRVRRQVATTFIHEFQHMISFHQHVILRGGMPEALWLNEGLSHLSEELAALHFNDKGDSASFQLFAIGNLINAYDYLFEPGRVFVIPGEGSGTLEERGAAWLFLRWVVDQYGDDVVRRMSETQLTGSSNIEAVTGSAFDQLLTDWFLANWVSDLPDSILADAAKPDRLRFDTWSFRTTFGSFNEQLPDRFPRAFPTVPRSLMPTGFDRSSVLRAGSGDYYEIVQPPNDPGFAVMFTQPSGQALVGSVPRLSV
ncbi:MAG: hypothetical protein ACE1ZF_02630, partial [Gemmatimonadales bacterium]